MIIPKRSIVESTGYDVHTVHIGASGLRQSRPQNVSYVPAGVLRQPVGDHRISEATAQCHVKDIHAPPPDWKNGPDGHRPGDLR